MRWRGLVKFLIFCWAAVIIGGMNGNSTVILGEKYVKAKPFITESEFIIENNILTYSLAKWASSLAERRVEYNVQPAFAAPKFAGVSSWTSIMLQVYPANPPARAAPEPKGPL